MQLVRPSLTYLPGYVTALRRGWSADNARGEAAAREELAKIDEDPQVFVDQLFDPEAKGPPVTLPDGSTVTRLPGFRLCSGMASSADPSAFDGNRELRGYLLTCWATLATAWSPGSVVVATRLWRWA